MKAAAAHATCVLLLSLWSSPPSATRAAQRPKVPSVLGGGLVRGRRRTSKKPAYERILSQPVFQVTTAWGSPYMLFEKYEDEEREYEDQVDGDDPDAVARSARRRAKRAQSKGMDSRPVSLFFVDEHDARALADEMKQMKNMKDNDLRVTCCSMGKAVRSASNLGRGLPTGQPVDHATGLMLGMDEGGSLRHRIVPSKRELFYAARCRGRERVGCFLDEAGEDAALLCRGANAVEAARAERRKSAGKNAARMRLAARDLEREGLAESDGDRLRREYSHMDGQVGLPVFHAEGLVGRRTGLTPLYFSYEDLLSDWSAVRNGGCDGGGGGEKSEMPEKPEVEVFNMMDVVSSIEKDQWREQRLLELERERKGLLGKVPVLHNLVRSSEKPTAARRRRSGLESVVFVPSSAGVRARERMSAAGSRKTRLRPMRAWGKNA